MSRYKSPNENIIFGICLFNTDRQVNGIFSEINSDQYLRLLLRRDLRFGGGAVVSTRTYRFSRLSKKVVQNDGMRWRSRRRLRSGSFHPSKDKQRPFTGQNFVAVPVNKFNFENQRRGGLVGTYLIIYHNFNFVITKYQSWLYLRRRRGVGWKAMSNSSLFPLPSFSREVPMPFGAGLPVLPGLFPAEYNDDVKNETGGIIFANYKFPKCYECVWCWIIVLSADNQHSHD